jgi:hypothetical protein
MALLPRVSEGGEVDASWCLPGKRVEGPVGSVWKREIDTEFRIVEQSLAVCHMAEMNTWLHERQLNQMLEMRKRAVGESIIARGVRANYFVKQGENQRYAAEMSEMAGRSYA